MPNLIKIESLLTELNTQEFEQLQKLVQTQIFNNRQKLELAIKTGDIVSIEKYIDKVSFDPSYLKNIKEKIVPHIKSLHYLSKTTIKGDNVAITSSDSIEIFYLLFKDVLELEEDYKLFLQKERKEKFTFTISDVLFANLFYKLKVNFEFSGKEPYPQYIFLKPFLQKNPDIFNKTIENFVNYSLSKIDYQENSLLIQDLIKIGYEKSLFEKAKNEENYNYMKTLLTIKNIYTDDFMLSGLANYHLPMVKESFENGIPFFNSDESLTAEQKANYKNIFSAVFSSKEALLIQEYIIDNIPDISIGNNIIVKTILHKLEDKFETDIERNNKRMELVFNLMSRYNDLNTEKINQLKFLLEKRTDSLSKELLTKFINFQTLNKKLAPTFHLNEKKNKI